MEPEHILLVKNWMENFQKENATKQPAVGKHEQSIVNASLLVWKTHKKCINIKKLQAMRPF